MTGRYFALFRIIAIWVLSCGALMAQAPREGLMWNRTGLPAVFPLQVKTAPGQNYVLLLSDPENGADVLAAYIHGGTFFRVLVPPGTFEVRFATGITWHDETTMFGRQGRTRVITLPKPLTFRVQGLRTKTGHIIDLTKTVADEEATLHVRPQRICQRVIMECVEPYGGSWRNDRGSLCPAQQSRIRAIYC